MKMHAATARNFGGLLDSEIFADLTILAGGEEFRVHRVVLAAQSDIIRSKLVASPQSTQLELKTSAAVARALIRAMYCVIPNTLTGVEILDFLREARLLGISELVDRKTISRSVVINDENCAAMLVHDELRMHGDLEKQVLDFVGKHLHSMVGEERARRKLLETLDHPTMLQLLKAAAGVTPPEYVDTVIRFAADWAGLESVCDLLKEAKLWQWTPNETAPLFLDGEQVEGGGLDLGKMGDGAQHQLQVRGDFFDWCLRLELSDRKLRIVYESSIAGLTGKDSDCPILRFPSALFDWKINGVGCQDKPVYICFPQGVNLHWSTTLTLGEGPCELTCSLTELPLNSLILYSFATDLPATLQSEDILNRLPHIEFRCVSSYLLFQQHGLSDSSIISTRRFA